MVGNMSTNQQEKIIILGIGNPLFQYEGLGIHALPHIEERLVCVVGCLDEREPLANLIESVEYLM